MDFTSVIWRKSARSGNGGNCVELTTIESVSVTA
jgi:hypothetical protein